MQDSKNKLEKQFYQTFNISKTYMNCDDCPHYYRDNSINNSKPECNFTYSDEFDVPASIQLIPESIKRALIKECIDEISDAVHYKSEKANKYSSFDSIVPINSPSKYTLYTVCDTLFSDLLNPNKNI